MYVIREASRDLRRYKFVGETYVHGLMDGEWQRRKRVRDQG